MNWNCRQSHPCPSFHPSSPHHPIITPFSNILPLSQFEIPLDVSHFALKLVTGFGVSDFLVWRPSPPKDSQEGSATSRAPHRHHFGRSVEIHLIGHFSTIVSGRCSQAKGPVSNRTVAISAFGAFLPARHTSESEP